MALPSRLQVHLSPAVQGVDGGSEAEGGDLAIRLRVSSSQRYGRELPRRSAVSSTDAALLALMRLRVRREEQEQLQRAVEGLEEQEQRAAEQQQQQQQHQQQPLVSMEAVAAAHDPGSPAQQPAVQSAAVAALADKAADNAVPSTIDAAMDRFRAALASNPRPRPEPRAAVPPGSTQQNPPSSRQPKPSLRGSGEISMDELLDLLDPASGGSQAPRPAVSEAAAAVAAASAPRFAGLSPFAQQEARLRQQQQQQQQQQHSKNLMPALGKWVQQLQRKLELKAAGTVAPSREGRDRDPGGSLQLSDQWVQEGRQQSLVGGKAAAEAEQVSRGEG